ncbi:MAG: amylo-alpha-1,6-glucosidase, partial [Acidobacteriota bacterium]
ARAILAVVERELLTTFGLRTLSPGDPQYRGRYEGGPVERDSAYHQGTVWPWLLGPFITAYVRFHGESAQATPESLSNARNQAGRWLEGFRGHLKVAGLGSISEIFDADWPHEPRGCVAQAWSVGEILRTLVEDAHGIRPLAAGAE